MAVVRARGTERDFVIHVAAPACWGAAAAAAARAAALIAAATARGAATLIIIIAAVIAASPAATAAAAIPAVKDGQLTAILAQDHLCRVAVLAALILPFAGFQLAFDIHLGALFQVLFGHLGEVFIEDRHGMPFGAFLAFARGLVAPGFRRGDAQVHDLAAVLETAHLGVAPEIADDDHLVDGTGHAFPPNLILCGGYPPAG
jgi:hypothetical protein